MITTEIKGFNQNNFERGWALLTEEGKVKNVCANCAVLANAEMPIGMGNHVLNK